MIKERFRGSGVSEVQGSAVQRFMPLRGITHAGDTAGGSEVQRFRAIGNRS